MKAEVANSDASVRRGRTIGRISMSRGLVGRAPYARVGVLLYQSLRLERLLGRVITGDILLALITCGIALGVFQFIYLCVTYRAGEREAAEDLVNLKVLYRRPRASRKPKLKAV